jgi:hypothetical protein
MRSSRMIKASIWLPPAIICSPVSTTPGINCRRCLCYCNHCWCRWHRVIGLVPYFHRFHDTGTGNETVATLSCRFPTPQREPNTISTKYKKHPGSLNLSFIAVVIDTGDQPSHTNISANLCKIWNCFNYILRGPGETESWKKLEAKNLVSDSL